MDALIIITNHHHESCGTAPSILKRSGDDFYLGYFENEHGEQFVLEINRSTGEGTLQAGDLGWDRKIEIRDDRIQDDIVLGDDERQWLSACWRAATGRVLLPVTEEELLPYSDAACHWDRIIKLGFASRVYHQLNQRLSNTLSQQAEDTPPATITLSPEELQIVYAAMHLPLPLYLGDILDEDEKSLWVPAAEEMAATKAEFEDTLTEMLGVIKAKMKDLLGEQPC